MGLSNSKVTFALNFLFWTTPSCPGRSCLKFPAALSFPVSRQERHTIPAVLLLFLLHHLRVLLVLLPCVHGKRGGRHVCGADEQQPHWELQQRGAATPASTCAAAAADSQPTTAATAAATATAVITDQALRPVKQHPQPAQQPPPSGFKRPVSADAQHIRFISLQLSVHIRAPPSIRPGPGTGTGTKQSRHVRDQQCQPDGWFRPGGPPQPPQHHGRPHFRLYACPLRSSRSGGGSVPEQQRPVQHFSREQHFHPHLWLQWSHHQRGRHGARLAGFQPRPQLTERQHLGPGPRPERGPRHLSGAPKFCQLAPRRGWHDGRQRRECRRGGRSRGEHTSCSAAQRAKAERKHKYVDARLPTLQLCSAPSCLFCCRPSDIFLPPDLQVTVPSWQRAPQSLRLAHPASLKAANLHLSARQLVSRECFAPLSWVPSLTYTHTFFPVL